MLFARFLRFLQHRWRAKSIYRVHSPFVYDFYRQVLPHKSSEVGTRVESLRKTLCKDQSILEFEDFGAGSIAKSNRTKEVSVRHLARYSARRRHSGEFIYRLCKHYQPKRCLEFGTNLGISTLYHLAALENSQFVSMEGAPAIANLAHKNLQKFGFQAEILIGEFDHCLQQLDLSTYRPDYVFVDGNHRYAATLDYFHRLLPHLPDGAMLLFDDINWSAGMQQAWQEICAHPAVSLSLDLFQMGLCFVRRPQAKEHFVVPFWGV